MTHYFKRIWSETTGDEFTDAWGLSIFYFETDSDLNVIRQIQVFEHGQVLKYDQELGQDEFGMLADQQLDKEEFEEFAIDRADFVSIWDKLERTTI